MAVRTSDLAHLEPQREELLSRAGFALAQLQARVVEAVAQLQAEPRECRKVAAERLLDWEYARAKDRILAALEALPR